MKETGNNEARTRKLIFVRHGKAEDQVPEITDFERSLTTKGKRASRLMARILKSKENNPGTVISSPAFRAIETAIIFCREFDVSPDGMEIVTELYSGFGPEGFVPLIARQKDDDHTVTIVGHNPLITEMAAFYAADEPEALPKTGIFCVSFKAAHWSEIEPETGTTEVFLVPKSLL
ncbi:MAG: histidine phosphatase family protein [Bacteroidales bacterium]|nr:histidine phosphatase family protein [Bacteroidales bacterium]